MEYSPGLLSRLGKGQRLASTLPIAVENARFKLPLLPLMWGVVAASLASNWSRIRALAAAWR